MDEKYAGKGNAEERIATLDATPAVDVGTPLPDLTPEEREVDRRVRRKIDFLILPLCALNYFFSSMDRSDIGNAKIAGFQKAIHASNLQYASIVSFFYIGYLVMQPVGSLLIGYVETWAILGAANMFWGTMTCLLLLSRNDVLPRVLRVLIGASEGLVQINNVFLTLWYTHEEIATRTGIWYSSGVLAGSFNGLIAYGASVHTHASLQPWQILFLTEGLLPIVFGPIFMYFYPSRPEKVTKFFTEEEKALCIARTMRARNTAGAKLTIRGMLSIFRSPETYLLWLCYFCVIWSSSGYGNFLPAIVNGLGFDTEISQLLTVPIAFLGFLSVNFWCIVSDRFQWRGPLIMGLALSSAAGFAILAGVSHGLGVRMFALCLINASVQPLIPLTLSFLFTNTVGFSRRALSIPLQNVFGQIGGLASGYTFVDSPRYFRGTLGACGNLIGLTVLVAILDLYFMHENRKKRARADSDETLDDRLRSFDELGTKHPDFYFTL
ncbi:MFS general substrate transporter [Acaromyces ingoldii]|uniref:MFS general substrate transporter n=1 Tax=Acaromyces ingoldii TaxID=215250 RepID=A0A316YLG1_9BASI|nr:MFS general substrate transporter [Acaromyces ingoldii]PWN89498.1 MFS general substrate transporter [Acaromyces ingoldii]